MVSNDTTCTAQTRIVRSLGQVIRTSCVLATASFAARNQERTTPVTPHYQRFTLSLQPSFFTLLQSSRVRSVKPREFRAVVRSGLQWLALADPCSDRPAPATRHRLSGLSSGSSSKRRRSGASPRTVRGRPLSLRFFTLHRYSFASRVKAGPTLLHTCSSIDHLHIQQVATTAQHQWREDLSHQPSGLRRGMFRDRILRNQVWYSTTHKMKRKTTTPSPRQLSDLASKSKAPTTSNLQRRQSHIRISKHWQCASSPSTT